MVPMQPDTETGTPRADAPLLRLSQREAWKSLAWLALVLGGIWYVAHRFGFEDIHAWVEGAGISAPLALIALKASTLVFAPLGGSPLYPVAGALFGVKYGTLYILIGDTIGATLCFFISRKYGMRVAKYFLGDGGMTYLARILSYMGTTRGFLEARIFFLALPEGVAYAAGLTTLAYWKFIIIQMGIAALPTALYVSSGDFLVSDRPALFFLTMAVSSAFAAVGLYWFYRKARAPRHDG